MKSLLSILNEQKAIRKYPELDKLVKQLADKFIKEINNSVKDVKSEMPYKAQYVLEEIVRKLEKLI